MALKGSSIGTHRDSQSFRFSQYRGFGNPKRAPVEAAMSVQGFASGAAYYLPSKELVVLSCFRSGE